jgi:PAS domain-containing protein
VLLSLLRAVLEHPGGAVVVGFARAFDHGYRVSKTLRQVVIFGQQDISRGMPFPRLDLVTCRNLLIYLKPDLQQLVLDLFAYSLHQSRGYLFLGKAEAARPTKASYELVNKKWKIYRCLGGPLNFPVHESVQPGSTDNLWREARRRPQGTALFQKPHDLAQAEIEITQLRRLNETMLRYTNVAVVTIDRHYRILTINAAARRLLGVHKVFNGKDVDDLIKALQETIREGQSINTAPIHASVNGAQGQATVRFIHTLVPITDASGLSVSRVFIYSEKVE